MYLIFDEAHQLAVGTEPTAFTQIRRILRTLWDTTSIFAFFLSTTGDIGLFNPTKEHDPSRRVSDKKLDLTKPFCALGLDHFTQPLRAGMTLGSVADLNFQARLGRPLYVVVLRGS